jgi:hypothetical protein
MPKNSTKELQAGSNYNMLTVTSFSHYDKRWRRFYNAKCVCGNNVIVQGSCMVSGNTKSCGCYSMIIRKNKRIPNNHSEITSIILGYKRHAKERGFKWLLTRNDIINIIKKNCHYCGLPPSNIKKTKNSINGGLRYSGIDRVDSLNHYTVDNIVPCCKICNYAKSNLSLSEFKNWAIMLARNFNI